MIGSMLEGPLWVVKWYAENLQYRLHALDREIAALQLKAAQEALVAQEKATRAEAQLSRHAHLLSSSSTL